MNWPIEVTRLDVSGKEGTEWWLVCNHICIISFTTEEELHPAEAAVRLWKMMGMND